MKIFIAVITLPTLSMGSAFVQPSNLPHDAHRFANNATAFSHVETARHEQPRVKINKASATSSPEMDEYERAIIAHSLVNNSASCAYQKMVEGHKRRLDKNGINIAFSSFSELNAGDKTVLVHERVNNAGAEVHQIQVRSLRGLYENRE